MSERRRLDLIVAEKCGCSRVYAREMIEMGLVSRGGKVLVKPGLVCGADEIDVKWVDKKYVSRGGYKLEGALERFGVDVAGKACADVGASTGGFTDCLLRRGAAVVYAIENGTGQLHENLRNDARVVSLENTDIRDIDADALPKFDIVTVDLSFISLTKVLMCTKSILDKDGVALCLVKPQFEVGRAALGKNGIVRDEQARLKAVKNVGEAAKMAGFEVLGTAESVITGRDGNAEYWLLVANGTKK